MALLSSVLGYMMSWVMGVSKKSIMYAKALADGVESSLREEFLEMGLCL